MRKRRLLAAIAVLAVCGGAGYLAWQHFTEDDFVFESGSLPELDLTPVPLPTRSKPVVQPVLKPYEIAADLSNVENAKKFQFTPEQVERLRRDHFLIYDAQLANPTLVYLDATAPFITSDIVLHVFHTLAKDTLHKEEQFLLRPCLETFLGEMLLSQAKLRGRTNGELNLAVRDNMVRCAVALKLLRDDVVLPRSVRVEVEDILNAVRSGSRFRFNEREIDGTLFQGRGDYTHVSEMSFPGIDEERAKAWLKKMHQPFDDYFRAIVWLQQSGWDIEKSRDLLGLAAMAECLNDSTQALAAYRSFDHVVNIFAEGPDGMTPLGVRDLANQAFGDHFRTADLTPTQLDSFQKSLLDNYSLKILGRLEGVNVGVAEAPKLLFVLPGRYNLTGDLFQRIQEDSQTPAGDDYAAIVLGANIPAKTTSESAQSLAAEVARRTEEKWFRSLGGGFQYSLKPLVEPVPEGFPPFTRGAPWKMKSVNTALGGVAQLNHLLFLYDKQAGLTAGIGDDVDLFTGYVEPNPEFFNRLAYCVAAFRARLAKVGHFARVEQGHERKDRREVNIYNFDGGIHATESLYKKFEELLGLLQRMSEKELQDVPFVAEESAALTNFGKDVRELTLDYETVPDEREKSLICDVATFNEPPARCLQVATGRPLVMLAVVPRMGRLYLAKGSITSYYEFIQPLPNRLTDEDWRAQKKDAADSWLGKHGLVSLPVTEPTDRTR